MVQKHRTKLKFQKEIPNYPADSALKYVVEEEVSFSFFWIYSTVGNVLSRLEWKSLNFDAEIYLN
jgi:hypothetical protein